MTYSPKHASGPFAYFDDEQRAFTEKIVDGYMFPPNGQLVVHYPALKSRQDDIAHRCSTLSRADAERVRAAALGAVGGMWSTAIGWHEFLTAVVAAIAAALNLLGR